MSCVHWNIEAEKTIIIFIVYRLDETGVSKEGQALMDQAITKDGIRQVDVTYVPNVHLKRIMDGVGENRLFLKTES